MEKIIDINIFGKNYIVKFDFANKTMEYNGKKLKIIEDYEYIYKVQKTQIKARNGIAGLYEFMNKATKDDFYYSWFRAICNNI